MDTKARPPATWRYLKQLDTLRVATYGAASIHGDSAAWNRVWPTGYVQGERLANLAVALCVRLDGRQKAGFRRAPVMGASRIRTRRRRLVFPYWAGRLDCDSMIRY